MIWTCCLGIFGQSKASLGFGKKRGTPASSVTCLHPISSTLPSIQFPNLVQGPLILRVFNWMIVLMPPLKTHIFGCGQACDPIGLWLHASQERHQERPTRACRLFDNQQWRWGIGRSVKLIFYMDRLVNDGARLLQGREADLPFEAIP